MAVSADFRGANSFARFSRSESVRMNSHLRRATERSPLYGAWDRSGDRKRDRSRARQRLDHIPRIPASGAHFVRRPDRASGLFPRRIRRAATLADRTQLCRPDRVVPVPAGPASSQVGIAVGLRARRFARRFRGLVRIHAALGGSVDPVRAGRRCSGRVVGRRAAARIDAGRGGGGRAGGVGHGAHVCPDAPRIAIALLPQWRCCACPRPGVRSARSCWAASSARCFSGARQRRRMMRCRYAYRGASAALSLTAVLRAAVGIAVGGEFRPTPEIGDFSTRSTAPARWCSAAATSCCRCCKPRSCRPAGSPTSVPGRLRRRAGGAGAVVHFRRFSGRGDVGRAGRVVGRFAVPGGDLPAVLAARARRAAVLGRACVVTARMQAALAGINAAVVGLLLAALYRPVWTSAVHGWVDIALVVIGHGRADPLEAAAVAGGAGHGAGRPGDGFVAAVERGLLRCSWLEKQRSKPRSTKPFFAC